MNFTKNIIVYLTRTFITFLSVNLSRAIGVTGLLTPAVHNLAGKVFQLVYQKLAVFRAIYTRQLAGRRSDSLFCQLNLDLLWKVRYYVALTGDDTTALLAAVHYRVGALSY